jgi:AraC-like DNA-binding protein
MSSRLDRVLDWKVEAQLAHYRLKDLADRRNVSTRQLGRFFRKKFGEPAHVVLKKLELQSAEPLLAQGKLVKEVARKLGLQPARFSRSFKRVYGASPNAFRSSPRAAQATPTA